MADISTATSLVFRSLTQFFAVVEVCPYLHQIDFKNMLFLISHMQVEIYFAFI